MANMLMSGGRRHAEPDDRTRLGIVLTRRQGVVWHNGGTAGYRTFIGYDQKARVGVVVLSNAGTPAGPDDIGRHLLDAEFPLLGTQATPKTRTEIPVDPQVAEQYVGRYQLAPAVPSSASHVTRPSVCPADRPAEIRALLRERERIFPESGRRADHVRSGRRRQGRRARALGWSRARSRRPPSRWSLSRLRVACLGVVPARTLFTRRAVRNLRPFPRVAVRGGGVAGGSRPLSEKAMVDQKTMSLSRVLGTMLSAVNGSPSRNAARRRDPRP